LNDYLRLHEIGENIEFGVMRGKNAITQQDAGEGNDYAAILEGEFDEGLEH
jgi:hypothetical protein